MSFGKAILTTSLGQNLEYVVHGESGLLVPPGEETSYQKALDLLLINPGLRDRLGQNARERVLTNFLWDGRALKTCLAAYQTALGSSVAFAAG